MRLNRFIGEYDLSKDEVEILDPKIIKQVRTVLRLQEGDEIILSDGKGGEAEVVLGFFFPEKIIGRITKLGKSNQVIRKVHLYLAILKKENFELAVQKAVECGVSSIVPVITERTIKTGLNIPRLEKIILEASEQSGRSIVPTLSPILDFKDALLAGKNSEEKVIFTPSLASDRVPLVDNPYVPNKEAKDVSIFIGPEGGFTEKEIELAKISGFFASSLGPLTLRGETAAIVGTYRAVQAI